MCGICGKFALNLRQSAPTYEEIDHMCKPMSHRGPDSQGIELFATGALGMRRLSIIDLDTGDQPIPNEERTIWVILNGEIYNYRELRSQLISHGHEFRTDSDTEVLVHLYEQYGDEFIARCNGMFALCIYDEPRRRLYLARDRVGKKPLFYYHDQERFLFASELKSLFVNGEVPREVNRRAIAHYLAFGFVATPQSAFAGIHQLEPAHYIVVDGEGVRQKRRYWTPNFAGASKRSLADAQAEYIDLLTRCVQDRLIADVPVGLLLSGGIDSCSIAAVMSEQNALVPTFTIRFQDRDRDEGQVAREMAASVGADHREMFVSVENGLELLPRLVWHYEQPFADPSAIPTYHVARMASQHVTVVLNGDGGDENFGGYWRHLVNVWVHRLGWIPDSVWGVSEHIGETLSRMFGNRRYLRWLIWTSRAAQMGDFEAACYWFTRAVDQSGQLLGDQLSSGRNSIPSRLRNLWNESSDRPYLNRILASCDLSFHLLDALLVKMDRATMANSLEARSPFLDYRMIEFAASLPQDWKVRGLTTKWFARHAMRHYLPDIVLQKKKTGFGVPLQKWMNGRMGELALNTVFSERALSRGYFDADSLLELRRLSATRSTDVSYLLYRLLFLELWHRTFIDNFELSPTHSILSGLH